MVNIVMGCLAPEKWWADQRAKRRTVVLVIVLAFYGGLIAFTRTALLEAAGILLAVGLAASVIIDRVVDGARTAVDFTTLYRILAAAPGQV
ncbi:hypothetical protein [Actinoplanes siamensis]|uniref:Uncharacterized protein n=1 Tax=Actinoplanes siamensis TaxID=1223317 RepID=A0A919TPI0_9ACTN|nr:hypothetical protein [Actinoplanes siamensis]GIF08905.1 hypothetical protein Asi03nite_64430 [Actinoplanes siamensis]